MRRYGVGCLFYLFLWPSIIKPAPTWPLPKLNLVPVNGFSYGKFAYALSGRRIFRITLSKSKPSLKKVHQFSNSQSLPQGRIIRSGIVISTFDGKSKEMNFSYLDNDGEVTREKEVFTGVNVDHYSFRLDKYGNPVLLVSGSVDQKKSLLLITEKKRLELYKPSGEIEQIYLGGNGDQAHSIFTENGKKYWYVQAPGGILQAHLNEGLTVLSFFPGEKGDRLLTWSRKTNLFSVSYWDNGKLKSQKLLTKTSGLPEGLSWSLKSKSIVFSYYDSVSNNLRKLTVGLSFEAQLEDIGIFPLSSKVFATKDNFLLQTQKLSSVYYYQPQNQCQLVNSDYTYKNQVLKVTLRTGKSKVTAMQYLLNQKAMTEPIPPNRPYSKSIRFQFIPAVDHYLHMKLFCGEQEQRYHIAIPLFSGLPKPEFYELAGKSLNRILYGPISLTSKEKKSDILYYRFSKLDKEKKVYKKRGKFILKAPEFLDVNSLYLRTYDQEKGAFSQEVIYKVQYYKKGSIQERLDFIDDELDHRSDSLKKLQELDKEIEKLEKELN